MGEEEGEKGEERGGGGREKGMRKGVFLRCE